VGLAHGKPVIATKGGQTTAPVEPDGHSITDEGVGVHDDFHSQKSQHHHHQR